MNKTSIIKPRTPSFWWLLMALTIMMFTSNLDLTVANLALAPIASVFISCAIGVAIAGFILSTASATYLNHILINTSLTTHEIILLKSAASGIQPIININNPALQAITFQAFTSAFQQLMRWCLGFSAIGFAMSIYLHRAAQHAK